MDYTEIIKNDPAWLGRFEKIIMLVFIDDSGDPGFKLDRGSTSHFVIAMVIFDDELEAEKTAVAIKELKRDLCWSENIEFRFFKNSHDIREKFLKVVDKFNFKIRCLVVDKTLVYSHELRTNRNSFYSYFIKEALKNNGGSIMDAKIRVDGGGDRLFRKSFLGYLRRELNSDQICIIKNCKLIDSKSNVLVQMADMVAGSINRSYNKERKYFNFYKKIIAKHFEDEWKFR
jgi:hypothetical protein